MPAALCVVLGIALAAAPDPIENVPPRARIAAFQALPDGTAVLGWSAPGGACLSRVRSDGTTLGIHLVPGKLGYHALLAGDRTIAVVFRQRNTLELATYSLDGERRWQQTLHVYDHEQDADNAQEIASGAFVGDSIVELYDVGEDRHVRVLAASNGALAWVQVTRV